MPLSCQPSPAPAPSGDYGVPLVPLLREKLLPAYGAQWQAGVVGAPGGAAPADAEYAAALAGAQALLVLGPGRLLAYAAPEVGGARARGWVRCL